MDKHPDDSPLQAFIRGRLVELGTNPHKVAKDAGLKVDAVRDILRSKSGKLGVPHAKTLFKLAPILQVDPGELMQLAGIDNVVTGAQQLPQQPPIIDARVVDIAVDADEMDKIPVFAAALGGPDQDMFLGKDPVDWMARPEMLRNVKRAYGVIIMGESMRPMYKPGQVALVHPRRHPKREEGVIIEKHSGAVLIKEYVRSTERGIVVQEYQPERREFEIPFEEISAIHAIRGVQEF